MNRLFLGFLGAAALMLAGCARVGSFSTVDSDGSLTRKITVRVTQMSPEEDPKTKPSRLLQLQSQPAWKLAETKEGTDSLLEASRKLAPGESDGGSFTLSDGGDGKARCQVKVVKREDGLVEYTETWIWEGKKASPLSESLSEAGKSQLKAALSPLGATEEDLKVIADQVGKDLKRAMLGPGRPMLPILLTDPALGLRVFRSIMFDSLKKATASRFPGASAAEVEKASRAVVMEAAKELDQKRSEGASGPDQGNSSSMLVAVEASVEGPGTLVDTNGEVDTVDGRVYWSMYLEAAEGEPLVLKAVYRP